MDRYTKFALVLMLILALIAVASGTEYTRVVPASEVLDKIQKGETVEYDHVVIKGDLNLKNIELPTRSVYSTMWESYIPVFVVGSPIKITYSEINGNVSFGNTIFNSIDFSNTEFNQRVSFGYSRIENDANFVRSRFNKEPFFWLTIFNGSLNFDYSSFETNLSFEETTFNESVLFQFCNFNGSRVNFSGIFKKGLLIKGCKFNCTTNLRYTQIDGWTAFSLNSFKGPVYIYNVKFNDDVYFWHNTMNSSINFSKCQVKGDTNFGEGNDPRGTSWFNQTADFSECEFRGLAEFSFCNFQKTVNFRDNEFNESANFHNCLFSKDVDFSGSIFNSTAYLTNDLFIGNAEFSEIEFQQKSFFTDSIFFNGASFDNSQFNDDATFDGTRFNCVLSLSRTKYNKMYIRWFNIMDLAYDDSAYLSLMDNFKKLGYYEDFDNCYIEYRKAHRSQKWSGAYHGMDPVIEEPAMKFIDFISDLTYGYGKRPIKPVLWSGMAIICFTFIWLIVGFRTREWPSDIGLKNDNKGSLLSSALLFSVTVFLSGTKLFIDPPEVPEIPGVSKSLIKGIFNLERLLGAFFSILFFLAIGATVVR